jgi:uncharacterized protein YjbJ (UPF0337 family)
MDENRIKGKVKQVRGSAKVAHGKLTGDKKLQVKGKMEKAKGKGQELWGKAKDEWRAAEKRAEEKEERRSCPRR